MNAMNPHEDNSTDKLRALVKRYEVVWSVRPEDLIREPGGVVHVGFLLELAGNHGGEDHAPLPGCARCRELYRDLVCIVRWAVPKESTECRYDIEPFDASLHYEGSPHTRAEVVLTLRISHRQRWDAPVDTVETQCLHFVEQRLSQLGVQKH